MVKKLWPKNISLFAILAKPAKKAITFKPFIGIGYRL
jgi:hypothetical protein